MNSLNDSGLFETGINCWRVETASHAAVLVDCGNYYRALHSAICKARHSIFILGWDIDSRIELLRGDDAENSRCPVKFFDLIQWRARQNPDLQIYLNRWEFSLVFASQREGMSNLKWWGLSPANVHFTFDSLLPVSACHHQKIIVIDDEIAFCGGMDVAIARWDLRDHQPDETLRADPGGMNHLIRKVPFGPYHDVQCVVSGQPAQALAEWCRERWRRAAGFEPVPMRPFQYTALPQCWPGGIVPEFRDIQVGIAMTLPPVYGGPGIRHVETLYLDMIAKAENFIYIENQYLTSVAIAEALNRRLRENRHLRVLIASCFESNGLVERKSMWTGRAAFREILESGNVASRVAIAYPVSGRKGRERDVRIHSKLMIVDDRFLRIGSSNLNNRSMGLDTECDLVFAGHDEKSRRQIAIIRNDLIGEHTGRDLGSIEKLVNREMEIGTFLNYISESNQHFRRVNDERFRFERFIPFCKFLGDPEKLLIPAEWTMPYRYAGTRRNLPRRLLFAVLLTGVLILCALAWRVTPWADFLSPRNAMPILADMRSAAGGLLPFMALFVAGSLFLPATVLVLAGAVLFGFPAGFFLALAGILASAVAGYSAGRVFGLRRWRIILGPAAEKIGQFTRRGGRAGLIFVRMTPLAPFASTNLALGIAGTDFLAFLGTTLIGMLPKVLALSLLGDSVRSLWIQMSPWSIAYVAVSAISWLSLLAGFHFLVRRWRERRFPKGYI